MAVSAFGGQPRQVGQGSIYGGYNTGGGLYQAPSTQPTAPGGYVADPYGNWSRTGAAAGKNAGEALKALQEASGLNLLGSSSASGAGGGGAVSAPHVSPPDMSAARAAAFNRAKDTAGQTSRSAIDALREEMAGRGLLGSGVESGRTAEIIGQAAGGLGEVSREQAIQDAANAAQFGAMQYQGDITQRGQDLSAQQANAIRQQQAIQGLLQFLPAGLMY